MEGEGFFSLCSSPAMRRGVRLGDLGGVGFFFALLCVFLFEKVAVKGNGRGKGWVAVPHLLPGKCMPLPLNPGGSGEDEVRPHAPLPCLNNIFLMFTFQNTPIPMDTI